MPYPGQQPHSKQVEIQPRPTDPRTAQRNINIITEPRTERHVPPSPELRNRRRHVGIIEILRTLVAEQIAHPDRHIRIPGKIKIQLQRIAHRPEPCQRHGHVRLRSGKHLSRHLRKHIRQQNLLGKPAQEAVHPIAKQRKPFLPARTVVHIRIA